MFVHMETASAVASSVPGGKWRELLHVIEQAGTVFESAGAAVDHSLELAVQVLGHDFNVASNAANNGSSSPGIFVHLRSDAELRESPVTGEALVKVLNIISGDLSIQFSNTSFLD